MLIEILFGIVIGLAHYFSEAVCYLCSPWRNQLISFSGGVAISYIFIDLFPTFVKGVGSNSSLFLSVLAGFTLFHVVEKYLYQHAGPEHKKQLKKELRIEESVVSFLYHFAVGIIIVEFLRNGFLRGFLFLIPSFLYTALGTVPIKTVQNIWVKVIVATSSILGVLVGLYFFPVYEQLTLTFIVLGLIIGVLSYNVTRHSIPPGREGRPEWFVIGAAIYSTIILLTI